MLLLPSCPKCKSQNYKEKFPELENTVQPVHFICEDCGTEFKERTEMPEGTV